MSFGGFYRGRRVLVTGHTGFKGSWLSHWLLELGAEVHGIALAPATDPALFTALELAPRLHHRLLDVRDAEALTAAVAEIRPDVVLHLAAQSLVRASYRDARATWETNVGGTVNLLEALRPVPGIAACVIVTSDKCYANREQTAGYREDDPLGGHDPYSASKAAAEIVAASYRQSFFAGTPLRLATARAGNVIGGGDWADDRVVTDFLTTVGVGRPLALRHPNAVRPWQHVLEPLAGYLELARRLAGADGERYAEAWNFGPADDDMVTVEALARLLAEAWGSGDIRAGVPPDDLHEATVLRLDCTKACTRLAWYGLWPVSTAVRHTMEWYRAHDAAAGEIPALTTAQITAYTALAREQGMPWAEADAPAAVAPMATAPS